MVKESEMDNKSEAKAEPNIQKESTH